MTTITVIQFDKGYDLNFTLKDSTGAAINLANVTSIQMEVQQLGTNSLKFTGTLTVVSAPAGTCKYTVASTDFDEVGQYDAQIQVNYAGGKVISFDDITIVVKADLPK